MLVFVFQCVLSSWAPVFLNGTTSTGCWTSLTGNLSLTCGSWEENIPTGATPRSSTTRPSVRTQPQPYFIVISLKLFQRRHHSIAFIAICCLIKKVMMNEKWGMVCSFSVSLLKSLHNGFFLSAQIKCTKIFFKLLIGHFSDQHRVFRTFANKSSSNHYGYVERMSVSCNNINDWQAHYLCL